VTALSTRFFVYGTMLSGEPRHDRLAGAELVGPLRTANGYSLVELVGVAALIEGGEGSVTGELYAVGGELFQALVRQPDHPALFQLRPVRLADGTSAESFFLDADQVRGKRRVRDGDWKARFGRAKPGALHPAGPLVTWARDRHRLK